MGKESVYKSSQASRKTKAPRLGTTANPRNNVFVTVDATQASAGRIKVSERILQPETHLRACTQATDVQIDQLCVNDAQKAEIRHLYTDTGANAYLVDHTFYSYGDKMLPSQLAAAEHLSSLGLDLASRSEPTTRANVAWCYLSTCKKGPSQVKRILYQWYVNISAAFVCVLMPV